MRLRNYLKYTNRIIKVVTEISLKKKKKNGDIRMKITEKGLFICVMSRGEGPND